MNEKKEMNGNGDNARTFTISKCPANIYDEFIDFAKRETGNNYAMAIRLLLEKAKEKEKFDSLLAEIQQVRNDVKRKETIETGEVK